MSAPLVTSAVLLSLVGCRFEEPTPSKAVYFAAAAEVPPRPADHITRFVKAPTDPNAARPPTELERPATPALCGDAERTVDAALAVARALARTHGPELAQPATVRIEARPNKPWRACVPLTTAVAGSVTLPAVTVLRIEARGPYQALPTYLPELQAAATGRTLVLDGAPWLVLESDPDTTLDADRRGAVERAARKP
jgi:hypothetical protein